MLAPHSSRMLAEEFLEQFDGVDGKWELIDGTPLMMAGGSRRHSRIAGNIYGLLWQKLRGSGCQPANSDTGLKLDYDNVVYPDVAIYCDPRDLERDPLEAKAFAYPSVVIEVLSPSTWRDDRHRKLTAYLAIDTVETVLLIDPESQRIDLHERRGPLAWHVETLSADQDVKLRRPEVTLPGEDIFAVG